MTELVFEVVQESDGGYCAECLTENIFTQGSTWDELRKNVLGLIFPGLSYECARGAVACAHTLKELVSRGVAEPKPNEGVGFAHDVVCRYQPVPLS